jgi:hypothetical protein
VPNGIRSERSRRPALLSRRSVTPFPAASRAPLRRATRTAPARFQAQRERSPKEGVGQTRLLALAAEVAGNLAVDGGQLGPLPLAQQRTGAGRCRHRRHPHPAAASARRHAPAAPAPARTAGVVLRARHPVTGEDHHQGRAQKRIPLLRSGRPLTLIFPGENRHQSGGRGSLDSILPRVPVPHQPRGPHP